MNRNIEQEAADALLDVGISLPFFRLKLPFCRERVIRLVMRRPYWGTHMRIFRLYLRSGISARQLATMSEDDEARFFDQHLDEMSRMLALTICRGYLSGILLAPVVAFMIRWRMPREYIIEAQRRFRKLRASRDFMSTITWVEGTNPFRPEMSQRKTGS